MVDPLLKISIEFSRIVEFLHLINHKVFERLY